VSLVIVYFSVILSMLWLSSELKRNLIIGLNSNIDCVLPKDSWRLLGKPLFCQICSFTKEREVVA
jgi:hypothetical protein